MTLFLPYRARPIHVLIDLLRRKGLPTVKYLLEFESVQRTHDDVCMIWQNCDLSKFVAFAFKMTVGAQDEIPHLSMSHPALTMALVQVVLHPAIVFTIRIQECIILPLRLKKRLTQ